jgi:predicted oxidoreductase
MASRFQWLQGLDLDLAAATFDALRDALEREDLAVANQLCLQVYKADLIEAGTFMNEAVELAETYGYDRIPDAGSCMIQMIVTGELPNLLQFGDDRIVLWRPLLVIDAEDTEESFLSRVKKVRHFPAQRDLASAERRSPARR